MYLLTNERYITYQTGFSFGRLGHAKGWDLGVPWGLGGVQNLFFPKFNQIWCVSYLHELHMHQLNFLGLLDFLVNVLKFQTLFSFCSQIKGW